MSAALGSARANRVRLAVEYSDRPGETFTSIESFPDDRAAVEHLRALAAAGPFTAPVQAADGAWRMDLTGPAEAWVRFRVVDDQAVA